MTKKACPRQIVTLDELPLEVRQAVMSARGKPISILVPTASPTHFMRRRNRAKVEAN